MGTREMVHDLKPLPLSHHSLFAVALKLPFIILFFSSGLLNLRYKSVIEI
jgi:hypothetical protein